MIQLFNCFSNCNLIISLCRHRSTAPMISPRKTCFLLVLRIFAVSKVFCVYNSTSSFFSPLLTETRPWSREHILLSLLITSSISQLSPRPVAMQEALLFKCNPAAVSEFSNFEVLRLRFIFAIHKLKAVLMCYLPFFYIKCGFALWNVQTDCV